MKNHFIELVRNVFINTYILFCVSKDKREWLLSRHLSDFSFYNNFKFYFAIFKKLIKRLDAYFIQRLTQFCKKKQYLIMKNHFTELCMKCVREYVYIVPCFRRAKESDYFLATYRKFDDLLYVYTLINVI